MRRYYLIPLALLAVGAIAQEEEATELAAPEILAFTITDGSAPSKELESAVGKIRGAYEEKAVLFMSVNLATPGGKHQGEMLFYSLGLGQIWDECKKAVGQLVLVKLETVTVLGKHSPKENLGAALDKNLAAPEDEDGEPEDGDGCGCDDGCGG